MFRCVEGAGAVVVQKVLQKFLLVGFCGWVGQGDGDGWWLSSSGILTFLL